MGHSYVSFGATDHHMHDAEIISVVAYLLHFAKARPEEFAHENYPYLSLWREALDCYGPGCLDLSLDETLTSPEALERFANFTRDARAALAAEPETMPGARLNQMTEMGEYFEFMDRPRARMLKDFDRLVSVVK